VHGGGFGMGASKRGFKQNQSFRQGLGTKSQRGLATQNAPSMAGKKIGEKKTSDCPRTSGLWARREGVKKMFGH